MQSASGSLLYNDASRKVITNNRSSVGRGLMTLVPFLDINGNGVRDAHEPAVAGVNIRMNGGRIRYNKQDTTITVSDLEGYADYTFTISESFENVAWHIRNKTVKVTIDPNQFKKIEIPVYVMNEVSGIVYFDDKGTRKGLGRVTISFYRKDFSLAGETVSEADGSFNFSGLPAGEYSAQISRKQMEKLHMTALPWTTKFTIVAGRDGDIVDDLEFVLQQR